MWYIPPKRCATLAPHDLHGDRSPGRHRLHCPEHRLDVPEDLHGGDIARILPELVGGRGAEQPAATHLQPLDPGGRHRFSAEQQPGKCLGVGERTGRRVEPDERRLGVRDVGRDIPGASSPSPRVLIPLRDRRRPISHHGRKQGMKLRSCEEGCARLYLELSF